VKTVLADLPVGAIVRHRGSWGVVCVGRVGAYKRVIDFWDVGREYVNLWEIVEVEV
jgi:hypothetical protein